MMTSKVHALAARASMNSSALAELPSPHRTVPTTATVVASAIMSKHKRPHESCIHISHGRRAVRNGSPSSPLLTTLGGYAERVRSPVALQEASGIDDDLGWPSTTPNVTVYRPLKKSVCTNGGRQSSRADVASDSPAPEITLRFGMSRNRPYDREILSPASPYHVRTATVSKPSAAGRFDRFLGEHPATDTVLIRRLPNAANTQPTQPTVHVATPDTDGLNGMIVPYSDRDRRPTTTQPSTAAAAPKAGAACVGLSHASEQAVQNFASDDALDQVSTLSPCQLHDSRSREFVATPLVQQQPSGTFFTSQLPHTQGAFYPAQPLSETPPNQRLPKTSTVRPEPNTPPLSNTLHPAHLANGNGGPDGEL